MGFITLKGKQLLTRKTFCYRIRSFNSLLGIRTEGIWTEDLLLHLCLVQAPTHPSWQLTAVYPVMGVPLDGLTFSWKCPVPDQNSCNHLFWGTQYPKEFKIGIRFKGFSAMPSEEHSVSEIWGCELQTSFSTAHSSRSFTPDSRNKRSPSQKKPPFKRRRQKDIWPLSYFSNCVPCCKRRDLN